MLGGSRFNNCSAIQASSFGLGWYEPAITALSKFRLLCGQSDSCGSSEYDLQHGL